MHWVGYAELAAAVSNTGGLGMITALTQPSPTELGKEIRKCRTPTKKPFDVNITLLPTLVPPDYGAYVTYRRSSTKKPTSSCTTLHHAQSAVKLGMDFLTIDGVECGGYIGEHDITSLILLRRARQELRVPLIASAGFYVFIRRRDSPVVNWNFKQKDGTQASYTLAAQFAYASDGHLTPHPATIEQYIRFKKSLGITNSVLIHGLSYGANVEFLKNFMKVLVQSSTKGIGVLDPDTVTPEALRDMHNAGIRSIRVNMYRYNAMHDVEVQKGLSA
ncbi:hypothetical protein BDV23DRAFT_179608 [Aspergillus alliaceus]|uniref:Uncharacterized protein n=1 Tax=Petromyces alliaceus TaxID=209559 RepID=A0A5N7CJU6_PETAA|nr:hypothetical protein BDV23DRAFT_179608 [Aspergillus alliaceus]